METRPPYGTAISSIREECLKPHKDWSAPTGQEIKAALSIAGWTSTRAMEKLGINQAELEAWLNNTTEVPYPDWCVICVEANLGEIWK